jgi:hypothetical protein
MQTGWIQTFPSTNGTNQCHQVEINSGDVKIGNDFGNTKLAFLKLIKNTTLNSPDNDPYQFNFTITSQDGANFTTNIIIPNGTAHSNMTEIFNITSGLWNVTEDEVDNWSLQYVECKVYTSIDGQKGDFIRNATFNNINVTVNALEFVECLFVNDNPTGYITGGGRINPVGTDSSGETLPDKVTHGFQLHCNVDSGPNNLEVNWNGNKFHLEELEVANCYDDGSINEPPPNNGNGPGRKPTLDVYQGFGYGRYNGQCGAQATWVFDDNGEPGKADQIIALVIVDNLGNTVLDINSNQTGVTSTYSSGTWGSPNGDDPPGSNWWDLETGNHQWTPHPSKAHGPKNTDPCPEVTP